MKIHKYLTFLTVVEPDGSPAELSKTADSDDMPEERGKWGRFFFGSKQAEYISDKMKEDDRNKKLIRNLLLLGGTAFTVPFFAQALSWKGKKVTEKAQKTLDMAALAESPVLSLDPELSDEEKEKQLRDLGKLPSTGEMVKTGWELPHVFKAPAEFATGILGVGRKDTNWLYPATVVLTLSLAGGAGAALAGKFRASKQKEGLQREISQIRNALDKEQFELLAAQRGIPYGEDERLPKTSEEPLTKTALFELPAHVLGLLALALTYGGYKVGENYGKSEDKRRKAFKDLQKQYKRRIKQSDKPVQLYLSRDMRELFGPSTKKERKQRREELQTGSVEI